MRKIFFSIFGFFALSGLFMASPVYAVDIGQGACVDPGNPQFSETSACKDINDAKKNGNNPLWGPNGLLTRTIDLISIILGIVAVLVIMIAGIRMTLSGGDSQKIANIRSTIIYAAIGLAVALLSQTLVTFVLKEL